MCLNKNIKLDKYFANWGRILTPPPPIDPGRRWNFVAPCDAGPPLKPHLFTTPWKPWPILKYNGEANRWLFNTFEGIKLDTGRCYFNRPKPYSLQTSQLYSEYNICEIQKYILEGPYASRVQNRMQTCPVCPLYTASSEGLTGPFITSLSIKGHEQYGGRIDLGNSQSLTPGINSQLLPLFVQQFSSFDRLLPSHPRPTPHQLDFLLFIWKLKHI